MKEIFLSQSYEGTRIRLQRVSDSRFFNGWIFEIENGTLIVRLNGLDEFEPKQEFFIQAYGDGQTAMFRATFEFRNGPRSSFQLLTTPQTIDSSEAVRVKVADLICTLKIGWFETVCDVIDLSPTGIGLRTMATVEKAEIASVTLSTRFGEIYGKGEVCYSKTIDGLTGSYRVGIELYPLAQPNQTRWSQLLKYYLAESEAA